MTYPFFRTVSVIMAISLWIGSFGFSEGSQDPYFNLERQKKLIDSLDLNLSELRSVKKAVESKDYTQAYKTWASYLRTRTNVPWEYDPQNPVRIKDFKSTSADEAASGKVIGGLVKVYHTFPDNRFDWTYNATKEKPPFNNEWTWQLSRMNFWVTMASAYRATGAEKYPQAWVKQFRSFVEDNPVPTAPMNGSGSPWRTIECGIRLPSSWAHSFYSYLLSPSVSDEDLCLLSLSYLEHARYLSTCYSAGGNWLTMEMHGLYTAGAMFYEFKEASSWRKMAIEKQFEQQAIQLLPDGMQYELSTSYHGGVISEILNIPRKAKLWNRTDEIPKNYSLGVEKAVDVELFLMTPDRAIPRFNDSWEQNTVKVLAAVTNDFPKRLDYQWVASEGTNGEAPVATSYAFDHAGFYAMRSGWSRADNFAAFRAGPIGYGHCQQDKLDFVIWAFGEEVLFSSGGGSYEKSAYRNYAIDTFGHNCILVDGLPQRQQTKDRDANIAKEAVKAQWTTTSGYDYVQGIYDRGYGKETVGNVSEGEKIATQVRQVWFIKPDIFIVADTLTPNDENSHSYEARWHLHPTQSNYNEKTGAFTTKREGHPNLCIVPLLKNDLLIRSAVGQTEPELLGWNVRKDLVPQNVPCTTLLHEKKGKGVQHFLTLFLPLQKGMEDPIQQVETLSENEIKVLLTDGSQFLIKRDATTQKNLQFKEISREGKIIRTVVIK